MDDNGRTRKFTIPNSYYVPQGRVRLLSPQHWAKIITGNNRKRLKGTGSETLGNQVILFWSNKKYKLTLPLCKRTNVATINSKPGYSRFDQFCKQTEIDYSHEIKNPAIAEPSEIVTDDEETPIQEDNNNRVWRLSKLEDRYINLQGIQKTNTISSQIDVDQHEKN